MSLRASLSSPSSLSLSSLRIQPQLPLGSDAPGEPSPDSPDDALLIKERAKNRQLQQRIEELEKELNNTRRTERRPPSPRYTYHYAPLSASYIPEMPLDPPGIEIDWAKVASMCCFCWGRRQSRG